MKVLPMKNKKMVAKFASHTALKDIPCFCLKTYQVQITVSKIIDFFPFIQRNFGSKTFQLRCLEGIYGMSEW